MPSFTIAGREYELITLDQLPDMELGDLEILEDDGGLDIGSLDEAGGVPVTVKLVIALVYISMRRSNPDATLQDAKKAKISVLEALAEQVATETNGNGARPPTERAASGHQASKKPSASSHGR